VRTSHERSNGVTPGAIAIGVDEVRNRIDELDPRKRTVFYCATGYRSYLSARAAAAHGLERPESLSGGILAWVSSGGDLENP